MSPSAQEWLIRIAAIIGVGALLALVVSTFFPKGVDNDRSAEEIALLKVDRDGDGFCSHEESCESEDLKIGDCNDEDKFVHPNALEEPTEHTPFFGDGVDNDCDGVTDEGAIDVDNDGDGFCEYEVQCRDDAEPNDCNDEDKDVYPGAPEVFRRDYKDMGIGVDNDCDGKVDEDTERSDDDGDGYCERRCSSEKIKPGDCDDTNPGIYPDAPEGEVYKDGMHGDGINNDCDRYTDEGTIHHDNDGDGYCAAVDRCTDEDAKPGDCNDEDKFVHPGANEIHHPIFCNEEGVCESESIKEDVVVIRVEIEKGIDYTVGDVTLSEFITAFENAHFFKRLTVDNDCDGIADNNGVETDDDGDGYCEHEEKCRTPDLLPGDCDDTNDHVHPGAREGVSTEGGVRGDEIDNDCDGIVDEGTLYQDLDKDGARRADGDCDDHNPFVHPQAPEWVDGVDNDCDGKIDAKDDLAAVEDVEHEGFRGVTYQVYTSDIFDRRVDTWAYDHEASIAKIDWETGRITLKSAREEVVVLELSDYERITLAGDELLIKYKTVNRHDQEVTLRALLQLDERRSPVRAALIINDVPRPGVFVWTGRPIDGIVSNGHIADYRLTGSPAGAPSIELVEDDPKQTAIGFQMCADESCGRTNGYLGSFNMAPVAPEEVWSTKDVTVKVDTIRRVDVDACNQAYQRAVRHVGQTDLEESFLMIQQACVEDATNEHFEFKLVFSR